MAEALFLTGQYAPLLSWLEFTQAAFPELAQLENNVFNELLRAFGAVARQRTGHSAPAVRELSALFKLDTHGWLLDYYQVHLWLAELHLAPPGPAATQLRQQIQDFARRHRMPFFQTAAELVPVA